MAIRKGLGKGKGKGYKNIIPRDPRVHSLSRRGIKQPQRVSPRIQKMLKKNPKLKDKTFKELQKKGVFLKYQADSDMDGTPNIKDCRPLNPKKQEDMQVTEVDEFMEQAESEQSLVKRMGRLGKRGVNYVSDMARKHRENREAFNKEVQNLNDNQLRELAIRHKGSGGFFSSGNPYEDELVRREQERMKIKERLKEARKPREPLF